MEMRTWDRSKITSYYFFVWCESTLLLWLKTWAREEYFIYMLLAKTTELRGRLKCQQGDTSWVWYYDFNDVGSPQLPYTRGLVVSTAGSNCGGSSLFPGGRGGGGWGSKTPISKLIKFLLKTNDRRGGMPDWAILSATYASAKTLDC